MRFACCFCVGGLVTSRSGVAAQDATPAGEPIKVGVRLCRPDRRPGLDLRPRSGTACTRKQRCRTSRPPTRRACPENPADAERVIRQFAQDGYKVIFTTSFGYMDPTINVAKDFPDTTFIHISGYKTADNVGTGFGKIEEPRYVSGELAGKMTKSNQIGYVAAFPIPEVIRGINAFTLGRAQGQPGSDRAGGLDQHLVRSGQGAGSGRGAPRRRRGRDRPAPGHRRPAAGGRGSRRLQRRLQRGHGAARAKSRPHLGDLELGALLHRHRQAVMDGTWKSEQYWGGWKDGIVDLAPIADFVPEDIRATTEEEIARFKSGDETIYTIFTGPIADQSGEIRVPEGQSMTDEELLSMNWFVEGVQGDIPTAR